jgi:uncharacterized protein (DUF58 family)
MRREAPLPLEVPLPAAVLERRRLQLRRSVPTAGLGAHRHRRMGQSLEFREFRDYLRGDDARTIDWAASRRHGRRVVRTFEAEERRTLFILLDCRMGMRLPEGADKLTIGTWLIQCLARIAEAEGDWVILGTLFGEDDENPLRPGAGRAVAAAVGMSRGLRDQAPASDADWTATGEATTRAVMRLFDPASAVVLITDGLFRDDSGSCARLARAAQTSYRSFHVVELDSWPAERRLLESGPFRLGALGRYAGSSGLNETTSGLLCDTEAALGQHRAALRRAMLGPGLVWPDRPIRWPAAPMPQAADVAAWFRGAFLEAAVLPSLVSRAS